MKTPVLSTKRLVLRPVAETDAEELFKVCSNPNVAKFLSYKPHKDVEETKEICRKWERKNQTDNFFQWAIMLENKVIGTIEFRVYPELKLGVFGWQLNEDYWHFGIMTEAAKEVRDFAFLNLPIDTIESTHAISNPRSGGVMNNIDMLRIPAENSLYRPERERRGIDFPIAYWQIKKEDIS